uniref:NADH-ubiquinone oxidoreductase chain 4L n=1 Tax=Chilo auricilius TaxID=236789 RepID=A0A075DNW6_CHIAR|nr:NADH dehydrogenase subunit 4L [Chilo auricilius]
MMIILNMLLVSIIMFIIGMMIFISKHKHLLLLLLSLEFMMLSIFLEMMLIFSYIDYDLYFLMVFLVFSVWEGALGLSIMVSMVRTHSNDYFQSFSILW